MIESKLVYHNVAFENKNELLSTISKQLYSLGYVTKDYEKNMIQRENQYPTGLKLGQMNIAICHTDPVYVKKDAIFLVKLQHPVMFQNAETLQELAVEFVVGLAFSDGQKHMNILSKLTSLLQDDQALYQIKQSQTKEELILLFKQYFK